MLCCKIIKSQNNLKLKVRTEFPNVWGEYKYNSNPYIQGTTVPCDYVYSTLTSIFAPVLYTCSTGSSPQNVLTCNIALGQEANYTVLIDLGLAELRSVRDSAKLRRLAESF